MELQVLAVSMAVIIGIVNGVQLGVEQVPSIIKIKGFISFILAVSLGIIFGALHWFNLTGIDMGLIAGLSSSGLFKLSQNIGGK